MVYVLAMLATKVSILLLYLRIFRPSRTMRIVIHVNLWINVAVYVIGFGAGISWFVGPKATGEVSGRVLGLASAIFNSVSDIAILLIPISMVWTLKMAKERKLAISAVFTTGIMYAPLLSLVSNRSTDVLRSGCVASLVRMALYVKHLKGYDDPTWQTYPEQLWS